MASKMVYLEQTDTGEAGAPMVANQYTVVRLTNTTEPAIGQVLTEQEVRQMIEFNIKVHIKGGP